MITSKKPLEPIVEIEIPAARSYSETDLSWDLDRKSVV